MIKRTRILTEVKTISIYSPSECYGDFEVKGILWYEGNWESDEDTATHLNKAIADWRALDDWHKPQYPTVVTYWKQVEKEIRE